MSEGDDRQVFRQWTRRLGMSIAELAKERSAGREKK